MRRPRRHSRTSFEKSSGFGVASSRQQGSKARFNERHRRRQRRYATQESENVRLQLSIAMTLNPRTRPIFDGTVKPDGIDLIPTALHPSEMFWRQLKFAEFDVSELSFSSLSMAKSRGDERFVGLPIFTTRHFFQNWILVRKRARIETPADMKGKRVGVPEYQQTAAVWSRGILEHEWGVAPKDMEFWMERAPAQSHGGATGFKP